MYFIVRLIDNWTFQYLISGIEFTGQVVQELVQTIQLKFILPFMGHLEDALKDVYAQIAKENVRM